VQTASFSPDGRRIVTAAEDHAARVWDAATGQQIAALEVHSGLGESASFSPDGQRIVTASGDGTARIWDAATGQQIALLEGHSKKLVTASFSPDGRRIVTASADRTARIWDVSRSETIFRFRYTVLGAALARGIGWRTAGERADLLMQDAPNDLYAEMMKQLGRSADDPEIETLTAALGAPLHPDCYLSPTQFAKKFEV
jgi:dipeptidyl aminopeptidase/acylaminoacyl peptidase